MKFNQNKRKIPWARLLPLAFALILAACGGENGTSSNSSNSNGGGSGGGKQQTGPATGRLLDTAVAGVTYIAPSGSGTTDEKGTYKYNHGDTVEFKLGGLVLGKTKGAAIVTPMELAGESDHRLRNLLVLFQSLDADGNVKNGIFIPASAASALGPSVNLESHPEAFFTSISVELQNAREAEGIPGPVKTPQQATAHFLSQGMEMLSTHIWVKHDDATASVIRIAANDGTGEYLQGEATPDDSCDTNRVCGGSLVSKAGIEYGSALLSGVNTRGFYFAANPVIDTNLHAGLSHPRPNWRIRTDGTDLITSDIFTVQRKKEQKSLFGELFHIAGTLEISSSKEPIKTEVKESRFSEMENDPKGIIGAWVADPAIIKTPIYLFFSNGKYMMVDPIGDIKRADHESCGDPGVEFASYTYDSGSKALNIKGFTYDNNGCAGFSGTEATSFKPGADGNTATVETKNGSVLTLHRISK